MTPRIAALLLLLALGASGGEPARAEPEAVLVSAAISLRDALGDAASRFEAAHAGARIVLNTAASGVLVRQIEEGAPADLYVSASPDEIARLERARRIAPGSAKVLASNRLVVVVAAGDRPPRALDELKETRFDRIAIGNPRTVPAGRYAERALRTLGLWQAVAPRLVLGESVRQVLDWVARGEAAAGLVYATDAKILPGKVAVGAEVPPGTHPPILYEAAVLSGSEHRARAAAFLAFLESADGRAILSRYGFLPAPAR